ncbi:pilin [Glycomyces sp. L485]|uniref:Mbov_0395 family pilin-like conjugal transfer protein n=1 Tax=Glycomyces sp. L485 TaxID=2909235 RepID=UPI001F4BAF5F|nr:pilin [Glycomyces sp. L485]
MEPAATETRPGRWRRFAARPATVWGARLALAGALVAGLVAVDAAPALAQTTTETVTSMLNRIRNWIMGLAGLFAVIMATIAGIRYMASSDPAQTEKAKSALRAAAVGLGLVLFAPVLIEILEYMVGTHAYVDD